MFLINYWAFGENGLSSFTGGPTSVGSKTSPIILSLFIDVLAFEHYLKNKTLPSDYLKNIEIAKVTTAVPITKELEDQVLAKILKLTGHDASIENYVNPTLLGGFILRVGDLQYDASISNHLNKLKKEFDNSHYIPKI